jgi:hypothetical protein
MPMAPQDTTTPGRWVDATYLRVGDELLLRDGRIVGVEALRRRPFHGVVYNVAVQDLQCYAVGPAGVLAHNINGVEDHHSDPKFMEGDPEQPLTKMETPEHQQLHKDLNEFLQEKTDEFGNHMRPQRGNSGAKIAENFTREERLKALETVP